MFDRRELKARGKAAFKANYLRSVVAALILLVVVTAGGAGSGRSASDAANEAKLQQVLTEIQGLGESEFKIAVGVILGTVAAIILVCVLLDVFLMNPLEVGCCRFFLVNSDEPAGLGEVGYAFRSRYLNVVMTTFLRDLYLCLWALLLVIPAFVKVYSYRLVPYILSENPDMAPKEAITLSRTLMDGYKMKAFLLDLSFIGWDILACITFGLVGVFYSNPWQAATTAELYKTLRGGSVAG